MYYNEVWRTATGPVPIHRRQEKPARRTCSGVGGNPAIRAVEPVQRVQPGIQQGVAPPKRPHSFFDIIRPNPHGGQNSARWLKIGCQSNGNRARGSWRR
jgi:hypothetical protein